MKLAVRVEGLTHIERLVLAAIASHADDTGRAFPGEALLSAETCLSARSVRNGVRGLEGRGVVKVNRRGRQQSNEYAVQLDILKALPWVTVVGTTHRPVTGTTDQVSGTPCRSQEDDRPAPDAGVIGTTRQSERHVVPPKGSRRAQGRAYNNGGARAPADTWLDLLNREAQTHFRNTDSNLRPIRGRIGEGHTIEEAERVVKAKVSDWRGTDYARYLRPVTIFGPKFDSYLQAAAKNGHDPKRVNAVWEAMDAADAARAELPQNHHLAGGPRHAR
ncbi:MAG: conserved phage C-terminal domain-containing protein [Candidatus Rokubacteria bacterium]|nr:conserved phage C-terminal domain-containing protein [Candidatus Rokubacteria bacterium]